MEDDVKKYYPDEEVNLHLEAFKVYLKKYVTYKLDMVAEEWDEERQKKLFYADTLIELEHDFDHDAMDNVDFNNCLYSFFQVEKAYWDK